tara:strand:+ start:1589 stop:1948 length:360 start_codon:yes stop_codon:yes gene_type:complete
MPKSQTTVSYTEIFYYAEEKHGIFWNPCNDLFFIDGCINYRGTTKFYPLDMLPDAPEYVYDLGNDVLRENIMKFTTSNDEILELIKNRESKRLCEIACLIINQFAIDNKLCDEFLIIGD